MQEQKKNYQKELEKILEKIGKEEQVPTLLLHSCCGPCSSYVMEYLSDYFRIAVFYFNPNITEEAEYRKRAEEQRHLIERMNEKLKYPVSFLEGDYDAQFFLTWQREWNSFRKEESAVFAAMRCGFAGRPKRQRKGRWISLRRLFPSVR